ncbi:hypothetical protein JCM8547_002271 [Rhodosporidiobolus lusitaniae]
MASSIANGIYWALMTLLAILAHSQLSNQEEVSTAEGNEASVWQNPLMVSLSLSILFPVLALSSFSLTFLISACTDAKHAKRLKITSYILTAVAVFAMAWSFGGAVMSFGSAAEEIQTACDTIDTECYDKYSMLKWVSIPAEIIGLFLLVWMFVATYHYRKELDPSFTNIPGRPTHSSSKYPKDDPEAAAPLTSRRILERLRRRPSQPDSIRFALRRPAKARVERTERVGVASGREGKERVEE